MEEKGFIKKLGNKVGSGVIFIAACFVAMYILINFCGNIVLIIAALVLLMLSAFLFLNAVFTDKAKELALEDEEANPGIDVNGGEFQLKITKHMKEMQNTQKEMLEVLKKQNTLLQSQIENLEHEIYMLSEKQVNQAKSIIKFNKENARQLAISERETLEHVMLELKKAIEDNAVAIPAGVVLSEAENPTVQQTIAVEEPVKEAAAALEEVSEADLFNVSELPGNEEYVVPEIPAVPVAEPVEEVAVPEEIPVMEIPAVEIPPVEENVPAVEEMEIPEIPEDIDLTELFDIPELEETLENIEVSLAEEPVAEVVPEPQPVSEPEPAADPMAGLSSDPNAMMSPEDIAKLLAAMGQ